MKAWRLTKDTAWPGIELRAGHILDSDDWLDEYDVEPEQHPDWFEQTDLCDECEREVASGEADPRRNGRAGTLCHGHDKPEPEPRIQSLGYDGKTYEVHLDKVTREELDGIFAALGIEDESEEWEPGFKCGTFAPQPEPPYPVPEDVAGWTVRNGKPSQAQLDGLTVWRTREHAEKAAEAHRKLDEALRSAFNVAALKIDESDFHMAMAELDGLIHDAKRGGK